MDIIKKRLQKKAFETYQDLSEEKKIKKHQNACEKYRNLSEEGKNKKGQNDYKWYKNLFEDKNQRQVEYRRNYSKTNKKKTLQK